MEKTANQGKKWGISRKIEPIFPLETKSLVKNLLSTEGNNQNSSFINATQQVYRYLYSNIVYSVCALRQRKPLFSIPCVKRQFKKNKYSILKVTMQKSVKIADPDFRWNSEGFDYIKLRDYPMNNLLKNRGWNYERSGLLYKGNILREILKNE